jgi:hypothetical protein
MNNTKAYSNIVLLEGVSDTMMPLLGDGTVDFVYIDGAHNYDAIRADINAWLPKVKPGGYIGGHDYGNNEPEEVNGVKKAVDETFGEDIEVFNTGWGSWLHHKER